MKCPICGGEHTVIRSELLGSPTTNLCLDPQLDVTIECVRCGVFTPRLVKKILASDLNKRDETPLLKALAEWRRLEHDLADILMGNFPDDEVDLRGELFVALAKVRIEADDVLKHE